MTNHKYTAKDLPAAPGRKCLTREEKKARGRFQNHRSATKAERQAGCNNLGSEGPRKRKRGDLLLKDININIRNGFKVWCARYGTNMTAALEDFMRVCANSVDGVDIKRTETKRGRPLNGKGKYLPAFVPAAPVRSFIRDTQEAVGLPSMEKLRGNKKQH